MFDDLDLRSSAPDARFAVSVCTGGGGLDLGIDLAMPGFRPVVMVEREAFAVAHLVEAMETGLLAPAAVWSDARTFDGRCCRGAVSGVVGGIPCQPHSLAGRRRGAADERDLWSCFRRILVQSGAWWCLVENVAGMLGAPAGQRPGAERVWRDLRRLGFAVEGGLFSAAEVGAPHGRERVFILGVADARRERDARWRDAGDVRGVSIAHQGGEEERQRDGHAPGDGRADVADGHDTGLPSGRRQEGTFSGSGAARRNTQVATELADADVAVVRRVAPAGQLAEHDEDAGPGDRLFPPGPGDRDGWAAVLERWPDAEPAVRRVADGVAAGVDDARSVACFGERIDRLRMLGNGVVPLAAAHAFRTLVARLAARGSAGATELLDLMDVNA